MTRHNQRSDAIASFRIDAKTGRLTFTGHYTPVGSPAHIAFLGCESAPGR